MTRSGPVRIFRSKPGALVFVRVVVRRSVEKH